MQRFKHRFIFIALIMAVLIVGPVVQAQTGNTYIVNTTADDLDANEGDGICETEAGECSLRAAVQEAEVDVDQDTIEFNISGGGVQTITMTHEVDEFFGPEVVSIQQIDNPIIIDGTTQPGYDGTPLIVLDGANVVNIGRDEGLDLRGGDTIIRGLAIINFQAQGIYVPTGSNYTIEGNYIGLGADGTTPGGNGRDGILLLGDDSIVGGATPETRNVISGSGFDGLEIAADNVRVIGNYIGTDASGTQAYPNTYRGVSLFGDNHQVINNLISGNGGDGIEIEDSDGAIIQGNIIGLNANGNAPLPNGANGIQTFYVIGGLTNALIGGTQPSQRNIISANEMAGIRVFNGNVTIQGNYIGTDITGMIDLGNQEHGVNLYGLESIESVLIGGAEPGAANVISGNGLDGIYANTVDGLITVRGNYIGTNADGSGAIRNGRHGIYALFDPNSLLIEDNVIAGNGGHGIQGLGENMKIWGNFIGVNRDNVEIGNSQHGVFAYLDNLTVGGINPGEGNIIRGNGQSGVFIRRYANNVSVRGNSIYANGGIGIDLAENLLDTDVAGVTLNDTGDVDTEGGNNLQNYPIIETATVSGNTINITGTLNTVQIKSFTLDFYINEFCDSSGYGEGQVYLGSSDLLQTDGNGDVSFDVMLPYPGGTFVAATAFDQTGNTSEFSACLQVSGGTEVTPEPTEEPTAEPTSSPTEEPTAQPTPGDSLSWLAPVGQISTIGNPTYQWTEVDGSSAYEIYVGPSGTFVPGVFFGTVPSSVCAGGVCSVDLTTQNNRLDTDALLTDGSWAVFINPQPGNQAMWQGPFQFIVSTTRPVVPMLTGVTNGNIINWTLQGDAIYNASFYIYLAQSDNLLSPVVNVQTTRDMVCGAWDGTTCSYMIPGGLLPGTNYVLYLESRGAGGSATGGNIPNLDGWQECNFYSDDGVCVGPPTEPTDLNATVDNATVTLTWIPGDNVTSYEVWFGILSPLNQVYFNSVTPANLGCDTGNICTVIIPNVTSAGTYNWYVQANGPGGVPSNALLGWTIGTELTLP